MNKSLHNLKSGGQMVPVLLWCLRGAPCCAQTALHKAFGAAWHRYRPHWDLAQNTQEQRCRGCTRAPQWAGTGAWPPSHPHQLCSETGSDAGGGIHQGLYTKQGMEGVCCTQGSHCATERYGIMGLGKASCTHWWSLPWTAEEEQTSRMSRETGEKCDCL